MPNHVHLVVETSEANISAGMQYLLGRYGQAFNTRHELTGHLFEGRFHSRLIETDPHLLVVVRYVLLNPVRAGLCDHPYDYEWSSYRATVGLTPRPPFLHVDLVLRILSDDPVMAREMFADLVWGMPARASP